MGKIKKYKTQVDDAIYFTFKSKKKPKTISLWYKLEKNQSKDLFDELSKLKVWSKSAPASITMLLIYAAII